MNGKGWKSPFNKPWFILQTKYLRAERMHCAKIHWALTLGTVALGKSYASYHSPCITDYTKASTLPSVKYQTTVNALHPGMPLKWTQMNVSKLVAGRMKVWRIRIKIAGCNSVLLCDAPSLHCASVFCRVQGYAASLSSLLPNALRALCPPPSPWKNGRYW